MNTPFKTASIVLLLLGIYGHPARAQAQAAPTVAPAPYQLKHHSAFTIQATQHNPFWPIGWEKGVAAVQTSRQQESVSPISSQNFVVTGISISSTPMAVINGQNCAEGETINAVYGGQKIRILVVAINDGSVVLQYLNKKYTVELKHPELNSKAAPREILPQDRTMILR